MGKIDSSDLVPVEHEEGLNQQIQNMTPVVHKVTIVGISPDKRKIGFRVSGRLVLRFVDVAKGERFTDNSTIIKAAQKAVLAYEKEFPNDRDRQYPF